MNELAINGWKKVRLDECFDIQQGKQVSKQNRCGTNQRPFLRTANIFWGKLDLSKLDEMNFTLEEGKKLALRKGDLLVCEGGDVGRTAMWNGELKNCYYQNHLHRLRKKGNEIDENFVLLFLLYAFVYAKLYFGRANITTIPNLSKSRLSELEILLPPIGEQKAIAGVLATIQEAIAGQEALIAKLKELKRSMMQFLFTRGTKGEKIKMTEIGEIPESWELVGLASVAKIERGKFDHRPRNAPQFYGGNYPFIQTGDITKSNGHIKKYSQTLNDAGLAISKNFPVGTIFITIAANIGYTAISEIEMACPDSLVGISPYLHTINVEFLNYYLTTQQSIMDAMAPRGTQKNINIEFLKPWKIILPSIKEQEKIAGLLLSIDKKIESAQNKLSVYQSLFKTLLHELMSGERKVKI